MANHEPSDILEWAYRRAVQHLEASFIDDEQQKTQVETTARSNIGAGIRLLMAGALAKIHDPSVDIRKPFTNLGAGSYSGGAMMSSISRPLSINMNFPVTQQPLF